MRETDNTAPMVGSEEAVHAAPPPPAEARRPRIWGKLIGLAIVVILVIAVISGIRKSAAIKAAAVEPPVTPTVQTATARRGDIGFYVQALGTVTPLASVNLYSQVNGRVMAVHYTEGQMVHKGEPLIDIDPRPYEAQLKQVQGTLQRDKGVLAQAEMDLQRYEEASNAQAIARQTYEDQKLIVEQYRGTVQNDIGQVEYQQVQLSYCHLTSPIDGRVGLRLVDPGNTVFSGGSSPIVVITQLAPISVVFNVASDDLNQVHDEITRRVGLPVDAYDRTQLNKIATGKLLTLDNQIDTSTGTLRFRGQFDNRDLKLYPNQFVNTRMLVKTLQGAILIPTAAVQRNGTSAFVYVVQGDTVHMRPVKELTTESGTAAVTGLREGEVVSTTGFDKLQDDTRVKLATGNQPPPSATGSML